MRAILYKKKNNTYIFKYSYCYFIYEYIKDMIHRRGIRRGHDSLSILYIEEAFFVVMIH